MPKYYKGTSGYLHVRNVENVEQLIHQLILLNDKTFEPYRNLANEYLTEKKTPTRKLKRKSVQTVANTNTPRDLVPTVVSEIQSHKTPLQLSKLTGGITETLHTITHELLHLVGADVLADSIFGISNPNRLVPLDAQFASWLVDQTYENISDRRDITLGKFQRIPKYDTSYTSVWENTITGELTLSIRGTKAKKRDILDDALILAGKTNVTNDDVSHVMDMLATDYPFQKYDVAAHSLGCAFIFSELDEHGNHWDQLFLNNPASSPLQNPNVVQNFANLPNATYLLNSGDIVSDGLRQQMNENTLENNVYFGDYRWSPISAHSNTAWIPAGFGESDDRPTQYEGDTNLVEDASMQQDTDETRAAGLS